MTDEVKKEKRIERIIIKNENYNCFSGFDA